MILRADHVAGGAFIAARRSSCLAIGGDLPFGRCRRPAPA